MAQDRAQARQATGLPELSAVRVAAGVDAVGEAAEAAEAVEEEDDAGEKMEKAVETRKRTSR